MQLSPELIPIFKIILESLPLALIAMVLFFTLGLICGKFLGDGSILYQTWLYYLSRFFYLIAFAWLLAFLYHISFGWLNIIETGYF